MSTRKSRKRSIEGINFPKMFKTIGLFLVAAYVGFTAISLQIRITANMRASLAYEKRTAEVLREKERYEEELFHIDDDDYLEAKARENGFVKPNERIFIDANKVK